MVNLEKVKEDFIKEVKDHVMEIKHDEGLYRHIMFKPPSFYQWFELVTYPDRLIISGDMGDYVFSRVEDMFTFFRNDDLKINAGYWTEKCISQDVRCGIKKYDPEIFEERILEYVEDNFPDLWTDEEFRNDLKDNVLNYSDNEYEAIQKASYFSWEDDYIFQDFFCDVSVESYVYQYLWCLYAIVWGIQQYDMYKTGEMK